MSGLLKQIGLLKARTLAKAAGGGGAGLSFSATPIAAGAASGAAAGQLSCSLLGTVSYSVRSGALAVSIASGALTTTATAGASGAISAKVRASTALRQHKARQPNGCNAYADHPNAACKVNERLRP